MFAAQASQILVILLDRFLLSEVPTSFISSDSLVVIVGTRHTLSTRANNGFSLSAGLHKLSVTL